VGHLAPADALLWNDSPSLVVVHRCGAVLLQALSSLSRFEEAVEALIRACQLQPSSQEAKAALDQAKSQLREQRRRQGAAYARAFTLFDDEGEQRRRQGAAYARAFTLFDDEGKQPGSTSKSWLHEPER
jgi:tetratricopeptide (TPR) repeat protein